MAVDYFHRLLIVGPTEDVKVFQRKMYREYPRTVGGETWTEIVPFCFQALYELAPAARRIEAEVPHDPYELLAWPLRRIDGRRAEVRYQFQTRNMEMVGLIRALARALPRLTFTLVTRCFDSGSIETMQFRGSRMKQWVLSDRDCQRWWDRAQKKFGLAGEELYADEAAESWVAEEMLHVALSHWVTGPKRARRPGRRREWWNRPPLRDLDTERELSLYQIAEKFFSKPRRKRRSSKKVRRGRKGARGGRKSS